MFEISVTPCPMSINLTYFEVIEIFLKTRQHSFCTIYEFMPYMYLNHFVSEMDLQQIEMEFDLTESKFDFTTTSLSQCNKHISSISTTDADYL